MVRRCEASTPICYRVRQKVTPPYEKFDISKTVVDFFRQIYTVYIEGFRPHILQISLQYLVGILIIIIIYYAKMQHIKIQYKNTHKTHIATRTHELSSRKESYTHSYLIFTYLLPFDIMTIRASYFFTTLELEHIAEDLPSG